MSDRKKRRSDGSFKPEWEILYFFISEQENSRCLVCSRVIAGQRKFTIERHYNTLHKGEFDDLTEEERKQKVVALKSNFAPQSEDGLEEVSCAS